MVKKLVICSFVVGAWSGFTGMLYAQMQQPAVQVPFQLQQLKKDDPQFIRIAAAEVDRWVGEGFRQRKLRPVEPATDEQFLRRAYLTLAGRIPTYDEAVKFLDNEDPIKRDRLLLELTESPAYDMHMFNFWADLLRAKDNLNGGMSGRAYLRWIHDSVKKDKPYNQMVTELVSAVGGMWSTDNGAVGYYVRDRGMPLDNMANTTRIFLGTQIECAQCHDHPHDEWSQMDFYQMAAFTHNMTSLTSFRKFPSLEKQLDSRKDAEAKRLVDLERWVRYEFMDSFLIGTGAGRIQLPDDYKYKDGKPNEWVTARSMMGKSLRHVNEDKDMKDARVRLSEWMTSPENPTFTAVIANRMWKKVMGIGLVEPVDNFQKTSQASNPHLLAYLNKLMQLMDYDLKAFQRVLMTSRSFQLSTFPGETGGWPYFYQGYPLNRLTAEQIWDSMLTLTIEKPDEPQTDRFSNKVYYGGRVALDNKTMSSLQSDIEELDPANYEQFIRDLAKKMEKNNGGMMMSYGGDTKEAALMRASELPSPTPPAHFLRKFGQSDREVIDGASQEGDVTQALTLMNGHIEQYITGNSGSAVMRRIGKMNSPEQKVDAIFLSILSRRPTAVEMEWMKPEVERGHEGIKNVVAALVTTSEFMHIQ